METCSIHIDATAELVAEMDRLGDEIAELSAHLDAAIAHLLELIRSSTPAAAGATALAPAPTGSPGVSG